jgi:hypothetical protein
MKSSKKSKKRPAATSLAGRPNKSSRWPIYLLITVVLVVLGYFVIREWPTDQNQTQLGSSVSGGDPGPAIQLLKGSWRRPDGGYILEIRDIKPDGQIEAAYFNPRPIHVAIAKMSQSGPATKVFVELRDTGYPGSAYNLVYDPGSDQLKGIYSQAALHEDFDVFFVRLK